MEIIPEDELPVDRLLRARLPFFGVDYRRPDDRKLDFKEIIQPFDVERVKFEASRCIHCPEPQGCYAACPLHNDIPHALWLTENGSFNEAAETFRLTSSLPEICGRVCPHEFLCQGGCVLNANGQPVLIGAIEAYVTDHQRKTLPLKITPGKSTGKKVAVIGGGPAGLSCAEVLVRLGYKVTIFEQRPLPGGLLLYGIPGFKLDCEILFDLLTELCSAGVEIKTNIKIGEQIQLNELLDSFDAVFIGNGAETDNSLNIPGEKLPGVYRGIDFLIRANVRLEYLPQIMLERPTVGKKVVIIGGGDTASDCLRTAIRLGAESVVEIYRRTENEMPGSTKDRSLAREEGAEFEFLDQPVRFIADESGSLSAVECVKMKLLEKDNNGRRRPVIVEDSNFFIEADTVITALGFSPNMSFAQNLPELDINQDGYIIITKANCQTSIEKIFAGGDNVTGPGLVVTASAMGRTAAMGINDQLSLKE